MMQKKLLAPERLRQLPTQFSWLDQQLVRGHHLRDCDHSAWALYLFLATVADCQGLSYYSDASAMHWLKLDQVQLSAARQQLVRARLLAYQKPLCQLLALPQPDLAPAGPRTGQVRSLAQVLRQIGGAA
jgi:hypothetical protein